jgi:molybdate/tungstate transport system substrate-binding protein
MFIYRSGAQDGGLPFIDLPDAINLGNPDLAETYARATHTTVNGRIFRGRPIRFSATILANAAQAAAAVRFLTFLLLPAGQALVRSHYFLPSPVLLGGDRAAVPVALLPLIEGEYRG